MDAQTAAVSITGLSVRRGKTPVLHGLDLTVPRGDVVGLLGPSGCGKSTLMRSIVGTQVIAGGLVEVLGDEAGSAALRHRVGYMTQDASVYDDLPVAANLRYFARVIGADDGQVATGHRTHRPGLGGPLDGRGAVRRATQQAVAGRRAAGRARAAGARRADGRAGPGAARRALGGSLPSWRPTA